MRPFHSSDMRMWTRLSGYAWHKEPEAQSEAHNNPTIIWMHLIKQRTVCDLFSGFLPWALFWSKTRSSCGDGSELQRRVEKVSAPDWAGSPGAPPAMALGPSLAPLAPESNHPRSRSEEPPPASMLYLWSKAKLSGQAYWHSETEKYGLKVFQNQQNSTFIRIWHMH